MCVCVYLPTLPYELDRTQCQFLSSVYPEFFFSLIDCHKKAKEHSLPNYFIYSLRENSWIHTFPKGISALCNAISLV